MGFQKKELAEKAPETDVTFDVSSLVVPVVAAGALGLIGLAYLANRGKASLEAPAVSIPAVPDLSALVETVKQPAEEAKDFFLGQ